MIGCQMWATQEIFPERHETLLAGSLGNYNALAEREEAAKLATKLAIVTLSLKPQADLLSVAISSRAARKKTRKSGILDNGS